MHAWYEAYVRKTNARTIEFCWVVARYGGLYASHIRGERETIAEALKEAIEIGEKAGVPVHVSYNCPKWGGSEKLPEMFKLYAEARSRGVDARAHDRKG